MRLRVFFLAGVILVLLLFGCSSTTHRSSSLPYDMDFGNFGVTLNDISFSESDTDGGYTTDIIVDFTINGDLTDKDIKWILKDDLDGFVMVTEKGKVDIASIFGKNGTLSVDDMDPHYTVDGSHVMMQKTLQTEDRYSVDGAGLIVEFSYTADKITTTYTYESTVNLKIE